MCALCVSAGKPCSRSPEWIVMLATKRRLVLGGRDFQCGEMRTRLSGDDLVAVCNDCLIRCWYEVYPVIDTQGYLSGKH
jgi:hypothetical protein